MAPHPKWYLDPSAFHVVLTSCTRELSIDVYPCCSVVVLSICVRIAELNSASMEQEEREREGLCASCLKKFHAVVHGRLARCSAEKWSAM